MAEHNTTTDATPTPTFYLGSATALDSVTEGFQTQNNTLGFGTEFIPPADTSGGGWDAVGTLTCCRLVLVTLGVVSNFLTCLVVRAKVFRVHSYPVYLAALALLDTVAMATVGYEAAVLAGVVLWKDGRPPEGLASLLGSGVGSCVVMVVGQGARAAAGWAAVALGVDRVVSLASPVRRLSLCTPSRALKVTLGIIAFIGIIYAPASVLVLQSDMKTTPYLSTCQTFNSWLRQAVVINSIIAHTGPIIAVCLCVAVQTRLLKARSDRLVVVTQHDQMTADRIRKQNNLTKPLLIVLAFRALFMAPPAICRLLERYASAVRKQTTFLDVSGYGRFLYHPSLEICEFVAIISHFSSFYLLIFASRLFRRAFQEMCCSRHVTLDADPDVTCPDPKQRQSMHERLEMLVRSERKKKLVSIKLSSSGDSHPAVACVDPVDITNIRVSQQDALCVLTHPRLSRMPTPNQPGSDAPEVPELQEDALSLPVGLSLGLGDKGLPVVLPTEILLREAINRLYSFKKLKRSAV